MSKKATIIIPVYNGEQFLARSVRDIFRQTYEDIELITIDDGSADGSLKLLNKLAASAPAHNISMRVFTQPNAPTRVSVPHETAAWILRPGTISCLWIRMTA